MAELSIGKGKVTLVDDEDFYWLNQWRWQHIDIKGKSYVFRSRRNNHLGLSNRAYLHRIVMRVEDSNIIVDHKFGNTLDNRKANLRMCTKEQNNRNTTSHKGSSSKYLGVSWDINRKKWQAAYMFKGKKVLTKRFNTEIEAAKAYDIAALQYAEDFANLNFK